MHNVVYLMHADGDKLSKAAYDLLEQVCGDRGKIARGMHGKPFFPDQPDLHFNLSHTRGMVACALSKNPVGVDIERDRPISSAFAARWFSTAERFWAGDDPAKMLEVWTRKEALLKRDGCGLTRQLSQVDTIGREDICSFHLKGFILSVCGAPARFLLQKMPGVYSNSL